MKRISTMEDLREFADEVNTVIPALNADKECGNVYYDTDIIEQCSLIIDYTDEEHVSALKKIDEIAKHQFHLSSGLELILQIRELYQLRRIGAPDTGEYDYSCGAEMIICEQVLSTAEAAEKSTIEQRWGLVRQAGVDMEKYYPVISDGSRWGDYEENASDLAQVITDIYLKGLSLK